MSDTLLIVTGLSGAGRSSCLKILEDLDFEAVDNLP
ncbi:MAG: RNase adaptor protein RapZ, partial [Geminicoccaceae bacterium]|nr:RNase adaptor protein RapZ [Geminicoccaceae bacterium]